MSPVNTPPIQGTGNSSETVPIWRYMDLAKFVSMLAKSTLWFTKAATFRDDPYEGFCNATHLDIPSPDDACIVVEQEGAQGTKTISPEQMMSRLSHISAEICERAREHLYVNSWCLASESMAMWEIYGSHGFGLALKSSVGRYRRALSFGVDDTHYAFEKVTYHHDIASAEEIVRDFSSGSIAVPGAGLRPKIIGLAFHKRDCYEYETEWRAALYQDLRPDINGIPIECDLEELVSAVYLGPRAEEFFYDAVASVMDKYHLQKPLEHSAMLVAPKNKRAAKDCD